jgi:hypothetical protein
MTMLARRARLVPIREARRPNPIAPKKAMNWTTSTPPITIVMSRPRVSVAYTAARAMVVWTPSLNSMKATMNTSRGRFRATLRKVASVRRKPNRA